MDIIYHPESTRSVKDMGWIKLYQSFHPNYPPAPNRRNFGVLIIFDNGHIKPGGKGFGMHPHDNMEIVSVVVQGAMVHSDTAGHNGVNVENAIQLISAGTGIQHSEYNYSAGLYPFRKEKNWVKKHYFEGSQAIKIYAITTRVPGLNIRFFLWI